LDVGITNTYTLSTGIASQPDIHGHNLTTINQKLTRKQKGSRSFKKAQQHRTNYINWSINQINLQNVKTLRLENIKYLRRYRKTSRFISHFTYTDIFDKLRDLCNTNGVQIVYTNPTYTSQRCNQCGWVQKSNRKGKVFKCRQCSYEVDADLNAARNIALCLRPLGPKTRQLRRNLKGFYWNEVGKHSIVASTQKPILS